MRKRQVRLHCKDIRAHALRPYEPGVVIHRGLCGLLLVVSIICPAAAADYKVIDWSHFLGPTGNGISEEVGWRSTWHVDGPEVLWNQSFGIGYSSFSVVGDRAYTMGFVDGQEIVSCVKVADGEVLWKHAYSASLKAAHHEGGPSATPTVDEERVYTMGKEGWLYCLSALDGKVLWSLNLPQELGTKVTSFGISCSPVIEKEKVIVDVGVMTVLDKKTGKILWQAPPVPRAFTTPTLFDLEGRRCLGTLNGFGFMMWDLNTSEEGGRYQWETFDETNCTTPVVSGKRVFISSAYDKGGAVLELSWGKAPKVVWENTNMRNHFAQCLLWEGYLYGFDGNVNRDNQGELRCVSFETGEVKWSEPSVRKGGAILSDGKIIALSDNGELAVLEATPEAPRILSRAQVLGARCWTAPVLSGGRIFCRNDKGDAVCLDVRPTDK
jgi:outer membrane protein assembly factor BamB